MKISLIHPSRSRPFKSFDTILKWFGARSRTIDIEIIVSLDNDDPLRNEYVNLYHDSHSVRLTSDWNKGSVEAINRGAELASGEILMVVSDDTEGIQNWDTAILKEVEGKTDWILKTQDGIQPWIITMPIMDRAYYNRSGYIYYPEYRHLFCDTELTCVADIIGRKITSNLLFPHNHYSIGKSVKDEVSIKADSTQAQGEKLFIERYKRNFDLPKGNKIQAQSMIDWLIKKHVPV
jgi:hypothetical protein